MKVQLDRIEAADARNTAELSRGEVVTQQVTLTINDGPPRQFVVSLQANVLPGFDASLLNGDELLEELLRFEPEALNKLLSTVGRYRRGQPPELPVLLLGANEQAA